MHHLFLLLFIFLLIPTVTPRPGPVKIFNTDNGIVSNSINCVFQDRQSFIWISSSKGLQRYDGYRLQNFTHDSYRDALRYVNTIKEDQWGNLYIASHTGGLLILDSTRNSYKHFRPVMGDTCSLSNLLVSDVLIEMNTVWIATYDGLNHFQLSTGKFICYRPYPKSDKQENWIMGIKKKTEKEIFLINKIGEVFIFNLIDKKFIKYKTFENTKVTEFSYFKPYLWIGTEDNLIRMNCRTYEVEEYSESLSTDKHISGKGVSDILSDKHGNVWVSTFRGLNIYNHENKNFSYLLPDLKGFYRLSDISISCLYCDKANGIWIGTSQGGLNYLPDVHQPFNVLRNDEKTNVFASNEILSIAAMSNGEMCIGTMNGITFLDTKMNKSNRYDVSYFIAGNHDSRYFPHFEESGHIIIGTGDGFLLRYNLMNGKVIKYPISPGMKSTVTSACKGERDVIYAKIYSKGIFEYTVKTGVCKLILDDKTTNPRISTLSGNSMQYRNGCLYIATGKGLDVYDAKKNTLRNFSNNKQSTAGIHSVKFSSDSLLWMGVNGGISSFNTISEEIIHYSFPTFEEETPINAIEIDASGNLWLGTGKGLTYFDVSKNTFRFFVEEEGYFGKFFRCSGKTIDGKLLFAGLNGVSWFYSDSIKYVKKSPVIRLSHIQSGNDTAIFNFPEHLVFNESDNRFELAFSLTETENIEYTHYLWQLEGYDTSMQQSKDPLVVYTSVPGGTYHFKMFAVDYTGAQTPPFSIQIRVIPFLWKRTWFVILLSLLLIAIAYVLYRIIRLKQKKHIVNQVFITYEKPKEQLNFTQRVGECLRQHLSEQSLDVPFLARQMGMSQTAFYNKMKEETGQTPYEFITTVKMEFAAKLLREKTFNVSEVADKTGYSDIAVFSRNFKKYFGVSPSMYK